MKITVEQNCAHKLPTVKVTGTTSRAWNFWELYWWCNALPGDLLKSISNTGYTLRYCVGPKSKPVIEFVGNTFSKENLPLFCITGDTKFVDKFSDLPALTDALITKVWGNLIDFIDTLPQPGDRGYDAYMALHDDRQKSVDEGQKLEAELLRMKRAHDDLLYENQKLKQQPSELEEVKARLAEVTAALKVVIGINKN
jgi:hypothetical protein